MLFIVKIVRKMKIRNYKLLEKGNALKNTHKYKKLKNIKQSVKIHTI